MISLLALGYNDGRPPMEDYSPSDNINFLTLPDWTFDIEEIQGTPLFLSFLLSFP